MGSVVAVESLGKETAPTRPFLGPAFHCLNDAARGRVTATVKVTGCLGGSESVLSIEWDEDTGSIAHDAGEGSKRAVTPETARQLALSLASAASVPGFNDGWSTLEQSSDLLIACGVGEDFHVRFDGTGIPNASVDDVLEAAGRHDPERLANLWILDAENISFPLLERLVVATGAHGLIVDGSPILAGLGLLSPLRYRPVAGISETVWRSDPNRRR
ncbi:MAG: hypothetical protein Q8O67_30865 [Deltaproteobacteria bacterium]|nr:hypothetical protein [Deltaproteobacteria bacterium]